MKIPLHKMEYYNKRESVVNRLRYRSTKIGLQEDP